MEKAIAKAGVLLEALPYLRQFAGETFVIKFGGSIQNMPGGEASFVEDVLFLHTAGIHPVIIHGGGREISAAQKKRGIESRFVHGLRVTDAVTMRLTAEVLGRINLRIAGRLRKMGAAAAGFSGFRGGIVKARKLRLTGKPAGEDLGFVGEVGGFFSEPLRLARQERRILVLSSVGVGARGELYNVNADDVAGALAGRLRAAKLVLMTDVSGIKGRSGKLLSTITGRQAKALIRQGVISRGMIPKVKSCLNALSRGVGKAHIIDGRLKHSLLLEIFTARGVGTQIIH